MLLPGQRRRRALHPHRHGRTTRACRSTADLLHPRLWVADIVYRPLNTALLQAARAAGCRTLDGGHMAVHQATDAFALITGITPDADADVDALPHRSSPSHTRQSLK